MELLTLLKQAAAATAAILHLAPATPPQKAAEWGVCVAASAHKHKVEVPLIVALVHRESQWQPDAVSPTGDYGLGQIHRRKPPQGAELADLLDPCTNLDLTALALRRSGLTGYNPGSPRHAHAVRALAERVKRAFWSQDGRRSGADQEGIGAVLRRLASANHGS